MYLSWRWSSWRRPAVCYGTVYQDWRRVWSLTLGWAPCTGTIITGESSHSGLLLYSKFLPARVWRDSLCGWLQQYCSESWYRSRSDDLTVQNWVGNIAFNDILHHIICLCPPGHSSGPVILQNCTTRTLSAAIFSRESPMFRRRTNCIVERRIARSTRCFQHISGRHSGKWCHSQPDLSSDCRCHVASLRGWTGKEAWKRRTDCGIYLPVLILPVQRAASLHPQWLFPP